MSAPDATGTALSTRAHGHTPTPTRTHQLLTAQLSAARNQRNARLYCACVRACVHNPSARAHHLVQEANPPPSPPQKQARTALHCFALPCLSAARELEPVLHLDAAANHEPSLGRAKHTTRLCALVFHATTVVLSTPAKTLTGRRARIARKRPFITESALIVPSPKTPVAVVTSESPLS